MLKCGPVFSRFFCHSGETCECGMPCNGCTRCMSCGSIRKSVVRKSLLCTTEQALSRPETDCFRA